MIIGFGRQKPSYATGLEAFFTALVFSRTDACPATLFFGVPPQYKEFYGEFYIHVTVHRNRFLFK